MKKLLDEALVQLKSLRDLCEKYELDLDWSGEGFNDPSLNDLIDRIEKELEVCTK